jgi:hypothetical protein
MIVVTNLWNFFTQIRALSPYISKPFDHFLLFALFSHLFIFMAFAFVLIFYFYGRLMATKYPSLKSDYLLHLLSLISLISTQKVNFTLTDVGAPATTGSIGN